MQKYGLLGATEDLSEENFIDMLINGGNRANPV
jgi:hypothetical protein